MDKRWNKISSGCNERGDVKHFNSHKCTKKKRKIQQEKIKRKKSLFLSLHADINASKEKTLAALITTFIINFVIIINAFFVFVFFFLFMQLLIQQFPCNKKYCSCFCYFCKIKLS